MRRERTGREWSPERVVAELAKRGLVVRVDYYRQIEAGPKAPGPEFLAALRQVFGSTPEPFPEPQPEPSSDADLAAAIRQLAEAIRDQMAAADAREARHTERMTAVLEALALGRAAARDGSELHVPGNAGR